MQYNRFVYPSQEYKNLYRKKVYDNFLVKKSITEKELKAMVKQIAHPYVRVRGGTVEEKIFSIFNDSNIRFGPSSFLTNSKNEWLEKITFFTTRDKPLQLTLLGFPFKMLVPLKTNRTLPDMGEVLVLTRLNTICALIKKEYEPGAVITLFTEGGLGKAASVPEKKWKAYDKRLRELVRVLGFDRNIKIRKLSDMEKIKGFSSIYKKTFKEFHRKLLEQSKDFMEKYDSVYLPIFRLINSNKYSIDTLMDVYNSQLKDTDLIPVAAKARKELQNRTRKAIVSYFSYLVTRDLLHFLEKTVPHHLALSVSPKPGRFGILPIDTKNTILPYHGVPVQTKNGWRLEYLIDIMRDRRNNYIPVILRGDKDVTPFYYKKIIK